MKKSKFLIITIALFTLPFKGFGQILELQENFREIKVEKPYLLQLNNPGYSTDFTSDDWESTNHINYGYNPVGWAKFNFVSEVSQPVYLELTSHFIDSVKVMIQTTESIKEIKLSSIKHKYFLYEIDLEKDSLSTILIRGEVLPGDVLKFGIKVWQPSFFLPIFTK